MKKMALWLRHKANYKKQLQKNKLSTEGIFLFHFFEKFKFYSTRMKTLKFCKNLKKNKWKKLKLLRIKKMIKKEKKFKLKNL
jgi:hypothetical protein